ncbi:unnamed protein product [Prunus armeniaca]|uniref:Uncharacterized protein n=1 Tax=Prunus armeniaca TaxID=36596 RepID=A0A6J5XF74_PRUAR|nr:unnamed protein product [Prunus armeniaca]
MDRNVEEPKNVINQTVIRSLDMQRARYFEVVGWIHPYFTCLFFNTRKKCCME